MRLISYEDRRLDQTTWFLGISLLPREGIALVACSGADRSVDNQLMLAAIRQRRFLQFRILNPRFR